MATEKKLIDVGKAIHDMCQACSMAAPGIECKPKHCSLVDALRNVSTVDAMEVVRCKDCRFSAQHDPYDPMECVKWATKWGVAYTTPDGYCHKGERKDNAKESNDLARSN